MDTFEKFGCFASFGDTHLIGSIITTTATFSILSNGDDDDEIVQFIIIFGGNVDGKYKMYIITLEQFMNNVFQFFF